VTYYHELETFKHAGLTFRAETTPDECHGAPWEECDGHGPVSDWTTRDKAPGERVLAQDRGSRRYYDAAEATRIAKRDGWGLAEDGIAALRDKLGRDPTRGDITAEAVRRDFDYLRAWCDDEWRYVVLRIVLLDVDGAETDRDAYLGGVESTDDEAYVRDCARDLAAEIAADLDGVDVLPGQRIREGE
jgi:hypothetical protein